MAKMLFPDSKTVWRWQLTGGVSHAATAIIIVAATAKYSVSCE